MAEAFAMPIGEILRQAQDDKTPGGLFDQGEAGLRDRNGREYLPTLFRPTSPMTRIALLFGIALLQLFSQNSAVAQVSALGHWEFDTSRRDVYVESVRASQIDTTSMSEIAAQISYCETRLALAQVIDPSKISGDRVVFGATVDLVDLGTDEEYRYQIVGEDESNVEKKLLSVTSPIAKALIGKEEGDEVKVQTPRGVRQFEVIAVEFLTTPPVG